MAEAKPLGLLTFQQAIRGGVRPNLFQVSHLWPGDVTDPTNPPLKRLNNNLKPMQTRV